MKEVVFGARFGNSESNRINIGGKIEVKIGEDLVALMLRLCPHWIKDQWWILYGSTAKRTVPCFTGKLGADGKLDLPEWTNPFGIPGGLRKLGVSAGIDFKNPIMTGSSSWFYRRSKTWYSKWPNQTHRRRCHIGYWYHQTHQQSL